MTTADASVVAEQSPDRGKVMSWLSKVFALNPQGLNWARGVMGGGRPCPPLRSACVAYGIVGPDHAEMRSFPAQGAVNPAPDRA